MDFVHQVDLPVVFAELVFGVHQDEPAFSGQLLAPREEGEGVFLELGIVLGGDEAGGDDFLAADVFVVAFAGFGGGGDDRVGELLVFLQAFRQGLAAEGALAGAVFAPGVAGQVAADHHFHLEGLAEDADRCHRVDFGDLPVGDDVGGGVEEAGRDLVEHLPFAGDALGQHHVEGGDAVGGDQQDIFSVKEIDVPDLSYILGSLSREVEIGMGDGFHLVGLYSFS